MVTPAQNPTVPSEETVFVVFSFLVLLIAEALSEEGGGFSPHLTFEWIYATLYVLRNLALCW